MVQNKLGKRIERFEKLDSGSDSLAWRSLFRPRSLSGKLHSIRVETGSGSLVSDILAATDSLVETDNPFASEVVIGSV